MMLDQADNIAVAAETLDACERLILPTGEFTLIDRIPRGHKVALVDLETGDKVLKFGVSIGSATKPIRAGQHVHTHNLKSDYIPIITYSDHDPQRSPQGGTAQ